MHLAFSKRTFDAHSSDWAQAHCLKDLNTLADVQVTGEGMPLPAWGIRNEWWAGYFLAFLSARFSFMVLAGFFFVSFFASWLFPMWGTPCECVVAGFSMKAWILL